MRNALRSAPFASLVSVVLLAACGGDGDAPTDGAGASKSSTSSGATTTSDGGAGGGGGSPISDIEMLSGDVVWTVTFDATAIAAGATNCTYTRHYEAVQDASAPWLCPDCEVMFRADVTMPQGQADCFSQVSTTAPETSEWIGYGGGRYFRGLGGPFTDQGTADVTDASVSTVNSVPDLDAAVGGTMDFAIAGTLTRSKVEGDVFNGFRPPATYACGWPKSDLPAYTGDYTITKGGTLPDGLFKDACDETVRLHDLNGAQLNGGQPGAYMVVDMAARDCPPCKTMASEEEAFIADMAAQGITVRVVTLLAPSLEDTLGTTTKIMLKGWINTYDLTSPVLADRGWGLSIFLPAIGEANIGYPSWVLVDPNLKVMDFGVGFGDFSDIETAIAGDAN